MAGREVVDDHGIAAGLDQGSDNMDADVTSAAADQNCIIGFHQ